MEIRQAHRLLALVLALMLSIGSAFAGGEQEAGGQQRSGDQERSTGSTTDQPLYGTIEYLEGQVTVNGERAQIGREVRTGDRITTGPEALAEIVFDDRNVFRLRPDTVLTLTFDENELRGAELEQGTFAAVFDKLRKAGEGQDSFRIRTPTTVGGVRGTTFFVRVADPSSTYVCTCRGKTHLSPVSGNQGYTVTATHHTAYRFVETDAGVERRQSEMMYHNDAVMEEIAQKIGVTIPWGE